MARLAAALALTLALVTTAGPAGAQSDATDDVVQDPVMARVRLTYYVEAGRTYSGQQTYMGSTACSWNWSIGQRFRFADGEVVTCNDRGMLGDLGWLDVFNQPKLATKYGPFTTVEVLSP